jgi:hypothetical protein
MEACGVRLRFPVFFQADQGQAMAGLADLGWAVAGPPVGVWLTSNGTFDNVMWDRLTVRPDGTGQLDSWSAMHGLDEHRLFWRQTEFGVLQIDIRFDGDEPDRPPDWETVRYVAATAQRDVGGPVRVLKNIAGSKFWTLVGPIEYRSPPD